MTEYDPLDADRGPFRPPEISTVVACLHCGQEYDSYQIEWRILQCADGRRHGFWCCPVAGCDGMGFGCDILPIDPDYQDEHGGWIWHDEEDAGEEEGEFPPECDSGDDPARPDDDELLPW
jgi:hypothetical protein